jgi:hypothetical protein
VNCYVPFNVHLFFFYIYIFSVRDACNDTLNSWMNLPDLLMLFKAWFRDYYGFRFLFYLNFKTGICFFYFFRKG